MGSITLVSYSPLGNALSEALHLKASSKAILKSHKKCFQRNCPLHRSLNALVFNAAKAFSTQIVKGEHYQLLNPVIALTITDFVMFPDMPVISTFIFPVFEQLKSVHIDIRAIEAQLRRVASSRKEIDAMFVFGSALIKEHLGSIEIAVLVNAKHIDSHAYPLRYGSSIKSEIMDALQSDMIG